MAETQPYIRIDLEPMIGPISVKSLLTWNLGSFMSVNFGGSAGGKNLSAEHMVRDANGYR